MTSYRVTFYKNLVNSNGHEFKCQQGSIDIRRARSDKRALQAAQRRYERAKKIGDWTLYADVAELERLGQYRQPPPDVWVAANRPLRRERADPDLSVRRDAVEPGQAADVDDDGRTGKAHVHERDEALASGQHACLVAMLA